jgi:hypothetical protein
VSQIREIFEKMPERYNPGKVTTPVTYYFSVGPEKWTATLHPDRVDLQPGRHTSSADCVLKCDPKLFVKMVVDGKRPGPLDIARGKIKTSSTTLLQKLPEFFTLGR